MRKDRITQASVHALLEFEKAAAANYPVAELVHALGTGDIKALAQLKNGSASGGPLWPYLPQTLNVDSHM